MLKYIKFVILFICLGCSLLSVGVSAFAQGKEEVCAAKFRHNMFAVCMVNSKEGWICGDNGLVYHTIDGGFLWEIQPVNTKESLFGISFANTEVGWVVGNAGVIFHTTDGGKNWEPQQSPTGKILFNLKALSADKAIACGDWGCIVYTSDGGKTWENRTYPKDMMMYGIDFVDENEGWIAGEFGRILHTVDSGVTWEEQDTGTENMLYCVSFDNNQEGLATGIDGLIIRTEDGGKTWQKMKFMTAEEEALKEMREEDKGNIYRQEDYIKEMTQKPPIFECGILGKTAIAAGDEGVFLLSDDAGSTWSKAQLPPDLSLLWFRGISLVREGDKTVGVTVGAKAVTIISEGKKLTAIGYLPEVTTCQSMTVKEPNEDLP